MSSSADGAAAVLAALPPAAAAAALLSFFAAAPAPLLPAAVAAAAAHAAPPSAAAAEALVELGLAEGDAEQAGPAWAPFALATLRAAGWTPLILSGGFRNAIRPLADHLGIARVEAVDLFFDAAGNYAGFDERYPTTRSGGKPELIRALKAELRPVRVLMVGDGVSDLETQPEVDLFIGFGRYVAREKVRAGAARFVHSLAEIPALLE
jgi:phosphoserine phosphatase